MKKPKGVSLKLEERLDNRLKIIAKLAKKHNKIAELYRDEDEYDEDEES